MSAADEIRQLADRLDRHADVALQDSTTPHGYYAMLSDDLRAAAVALRHHANLTDAIGDPDDLRATGDRLRSLDPYWVEAEDRKLRLYRIADAAAAVSPPPTPTCPTCRSDNPDMIGRECIRDNITDTPDSWHQATT